MDKLITDYKKKGKKIPKKKKKKLKPITKKWKKIFF
jgi:hypothetical protein